MKASSHLVGSEGVHPALALDCASKASVHVLALEQLLPSMEWLQQAQIHCLSLLGFSWSERRVAVIGLSIRCK